MNKYSNFLTVILVLIIIAIIGIIGFLGFKFYETTTNKNNSEEFVDAYGNQSQKNPNKNNDSNSQPNENENENDLNEMFQGVEDNKNNETSSGVSSGKKYNGYLVSGTIEIPATNLKCPILDSSEYSSAALETSVVELYGVGLNKVGNTTISGHNYRNGTFFSNNKKLKIGDKIYITDSTGRRLTYTIYDKFETSSNDSEYMSRDTQGAIEISLSTCTDDSKARLIILAKANV